MAAGDIFTNTFTQYADRFTGATVKRLTSPDMLCHHEYFYYKMMTNDGRFLIYACDRSGRRELFRMDLQSGQALQLTEGEVNDYSACLTSDDRFLICSRPDRISRIDMETLSEETVYEVPDGWIKGSVSLSGDDRRIVEVEMSAHDQVRNNGNWGFFRPQCAAKPLCRMRIIDIPTQHVTTILEQHCWLGHAQFRPHDADTILYCHEGPWDMIDARLWLIRADGTNVRCAREQHNVVMTHEFWLSDGSRFGYVYRENEEPKRETVRFIDPDTLRETVLMECSRYKHFIANPAGTLLVGDGEIPGKEFIYLADMRKKTETPLCWHGSSWKSYGNVQDSHPHPAFSPDGSFVIFTSDMDGSPCVYQAFIGGR